MYLSSFILIPPFFYNYFASSEQPDLANFFKTSGLKLDIVVSSPMPFLQNIFCPSHHLLKIFLERRNLILSVMKNYLFRGYFKGRGLNQKYHLRGSPYLYP